MPQGSFRKVDVDGFNVFYREAGSKGAPTILLLHGFPSASHMFRDLIPLLADRFHLVAPELPGFGQSDMPGRGPFAYTFDNIARVIDRFTEVVGLDRFALYVLTTARRPGSGSPHGTPCALLRSSRRMGMPTRRD
jgi:pimeloyl-ACP methyl ester carboxylesterase